MGVDPERSRKLILDTTREDIRLVLIRAADVPTYVQYGAADLGVTGKDVLMEHGGEGLYEPLDLRIARCRLLVAGTPESQRVGGRLRVATKYLNSTRRHFAAHVCNDAISDVANGESQLGRTFLVECNLDFRVAALDRRFDVREAIRGRHRLDDEPADARQAVQVVS